MINSLGSLSYLGLGIITCATLMLQIALTRIFSVIMWYHMSLVCVSMAMLGMTIGALIVEWRKDSFNHDNVIRSCSYHSLCFSITTVICIIECVSTPFIQDFSFMGIIRMILWNVVVAIPFVFSGIIVCAMLTRFPEKIGKVYTADLLGASLGCVLIVFLLNLMDPISAIILMGSMGAFAAFCFARNASLKNRSIASLAICFLFFILAIVNTYTKTARIRYVLGEPYDSNHKSESWNVYSYVTESFPKVERHYWGGGDHALPTGPDENIEIAMDTRANTRLIKFNGDWDSVSWLLDDATNVAHLVRDDGPVLAIGVGGGRDILSSLIISKGKREVDGVEINPKMINILANTAKEFSGGIASLPNVHLHVDEARSWTERTNKKFQLIMIPLVDTSVASAAGAYALTENSLYTLEAFELFLNRLTPDGILSVSRWWFSGNLGETHRLLNLAVETLKKAGVKDPKSHLILVRGSLLTTLLMSKNPFTPQDISKIDEEAKNRGFEILLLPGHRGNEVLARSFENPDWYKGEHDKGNFLNLSPPTDDKPFFFHLTNLSAVFKDVTSMGALENIGIAYYDFYAMQFLAGLIILVSLIALILFAIPLTKILKNGNKVTLTNNIIAFGYFSSLGLGFMLYESALIQRLSVFLGNPVYALSVVLFTLLLATSLGSYAASFLIKLKQIPVLKISVVQVIILVVLGIFISDIISYFASSTTPIRILVAVLLIFPASFFMGMFFPVGISLIAKIKDISGPWCWAFNGMTSTCAAIYSIGLSISYGISSTFWVATGFYVLAGALGLLLISRTMKNTEISTS